MMMMMTVMMMIVKCVLISLWHRTRFQPVPDISKHQKFYVHVPLNLFRCLDLEHSIKCKMVTVRILTAISINSLEVVLATRAREQRGIKWEQKVGGREGGASDGNARNVLNIA